MSPSLKWKLHGTQGLFSSLFYRPMSSHNAYPAHNSDSAFVGWCNERVSDCTHLVLYFLLYRQLLTVWGLSNREDWTVTFYPSTYGGTRRDITGGGGDLFLVSIYSFSSPVLPLLCFCLFHKITDKVRSCVSREKGIFRSTLRTFCKTALEFQAESMALDPDISKFSTIHLINLVIRLNQIKTMSVSSCCWEGGEGELDSRRAQVGRGICGRWQFHSHRRGTELHFQLPL